MKNWRTSFTRAPEPGRAGAWCALALAAVVFCGVWSLLAGSVSLPAGQLLQALVSADKTGTAGRILFYSRLPRTAAALCAGAALAAAGVILQILLDNPLAGPNIIGVNSGAVFGAVVCCAVFPGAVGLVPAFAFLGALGAVFLVWGLARRVGASRMTIVLAGVAAGSLLSALSDAVQTFLPEAIFTGADFRMGGLAGLRTGTLWPACGLIGLALLLAHLMRGELDLLALGDDTARSLGLAAGRCRGILLAAAACLAGAAVSFAGMVGFVGLIVPHIGRRLVGSEARLLLPFSCLAGAALMAGCDTLGRVLFAPYELPVGILLSLLGAPFFLWLLLGRKGGHDR